MANVKNYKEQGGERDVIGGSLDVISGGEIDVESGASLKLAGTAISKTAAQINALPIVEQAAVADTEAAYAEADIDTDAELVAVINVIAGVLNDALAKLRLANIIAE